MLESGRIGGVSGDGNVYVFLPHDGNAFGNGICAVAVHLSTKSLGIRLALDFLNGVGVGVILGFNESKAVDS